MLRLSIDRARALCQAAFNDVGLPADQAEICTDSILFASLRGLDSHGIITILPGLIHRIVDGQVDRSAPLEIRRDDTVTALLKGNGTIGPVAGARAMGLAIEKARAHGIGVVNAFNCDHFGAASYYTSLAVEAGMIGLCLCNAGANVAPYGGRSAVHGTNPISYGFPGGAEGPIILDIATSAAAFGQIAKANRRGQPIPAGWALDAAGHPTTDPAAALQGTLLPFGGHKGFGMGLLVDVMTGALAGSTVMREVIHTGAPRTRGQSFYMQAIDVGRFAPPEVFQERMDQIIREVHAIPPAEGYTDVLVPGDLERRSEDERRRRGIPLYAEDWQAIVSGLERAGISADLIGSYTPEEE